MATLTPKTFSGKRLVKYLMDKKGVDTIFIEKKKNRIVALVNKSFTPAQAEQMCKDVGRSEFQPFHTEAKDGKPAVNGIIFPSV